MLACSPQMPDPLVPQAQASGLLPKILHMIGIDRHSAIFSVALRLGDPEATAGLPPDSCAALRTLGVSPADAAVLSALCDAIACAPAHGDAGARAAVALRRIWREPDGWRLGVHMGLRLARPEGRAEAMVVLRGAGITLGDVADALLGALCRSAHASSAGGDKREGGSESGGEDGGGSEGGGDSGDATLWRDCLCSLAASEPVVVSALVVALGHTDRAWQLEASTVLQHTHLAPADIVRMLVARAQARPAALRRGLTPHRCDRAGLGVRFESAVTDSTGLGRRAMAARSLCVRWRSSASPTAVCSTCSPPLSFMPLLTCSPALPLFHRPHTSSATPTTPTPNPSASSAVPPRRLPTARCGAAGARRGVARAALAADRRTAARAAAPPRTDGLADRHRRAPSVWPRHAHLIG